MRARRPAWPDLRIVTHPWRRLGGVAAGAAAGGLACLLAGRTVRRERLLRRYRRDLGAARETHRALVENLPDIVARYDLDLRCAWISPSIASIGRAPEDYLGRNPEETGAPPELTARWRAHMTEARDGDRETRFAFTYDTGGAERRLEARIVPEHDARGAVVSLLVTVRDVGELLAADERLRRAHEYAEAIVDSMSDGLLVVGHDGAIEHVSNRLLDMTGFARAELIGSRPPFPFHAPEELVQVRRELAGILDTGGSGEFALTYRRRDGRRFPVTVSASPLRDADGRLVGGVRLVRDVTAARESEDALRASEERHRGLIAAMADGVVVHGPRGEIVDCNPAATRILGVSRGRLLGRGPRDHEWNAVSEDGSPLPGDEHPAAVTLRTGMPQRHVLMGVHRPDGGRVWLHVSSEPLDPGAARGVVATFTDVTGRIESEREQDSLRRLATMVAAEAEPAHVFESLAREAARAAEAEGAALLRFEGGLGFARAVGAWPAASGPAAGRAFDIAEGSLVGRVGRSAAPGRMDAGPEGPLASPVMPDAAVVSSVAAPIVVAGEVWGVLAAASTAGRPLPPSTEARLTRMGEIATLAVVAADARAQLAALASTDHLTGLWNRRAFEERLAAEADRSRRYGRGLGLVLMDLDHFKLINDTHGHPAGDRVLVEFAARLRAEARGGEVLARVGGEEFAWILPEADGAHAVMAAERLRRAVAAEPFPEVGRLTVSAGVCASADAPHEGDLLRLADVALYWAKAEGRDRVFRYSPDTGAPLAPGEQERRLERARAFAGVKALARAVDAKDPLTQRHSERVGAMARGLARELGWSWERADLLHQAALVHDVGKIAIPDSILFAARPLTDAERTRVRDHAALGATIIEDALSPEQVSWVRGHHERVDGGGYPDGLAGDDIPHGARILALADAWDAMTVARPYGTPRPPEQAWRQCCAGAGRQFDETAVAALGRVLGRDGSEASAGGVTDAGPDTEPGAGTRREG